MKSSNELSCAKSISFTRKIFFPLCCAIFIFIAVFVSILIQLECSHSHGFFYVGLRLSEISIKFWILPFDSFSPTFPHAQSSHSKTTLISFSFYLFPPADIINNSERPATSLSLILSSSCSIFLVRKLKTSSRVESCESSAMHRESHRLRAEVRKTIKENFR